VLHVQFNARSETVQEKSVFSRLLSSQRCIFMCEGFYEWKKVGELDSLTLQLCSVWSQLDRTLGLSSRPAMQAPCHPEAGQANVLQKQDGSKKQPYYISFGEDSVMHMAALYDVWHTGEDNETLGTFTILTTDSSPRLRWCMAHRPCTANRDIVCRT
jgi:putative SOS response-associated peptidase YedK